MTIPTTSTGGEPTADDINTLAHLNSRMLVGDGGSVTIKTADAWRYRQALGRFLADNAKDARVAELKGMLAVAKSALKPFATVFNDWIGSGQPVGIISMVTDASAHGRLGSKHFRRAAQAIAQLDKEAGGK